MTTSVNIVNQDVKVNIVQEDITLDIQSGGLVPISDDFSLTAGTNLSALRAVTTNGSGEAVYASTDTLANATVFGITSTAADAGNAVSVHSSGILEDANWNWTKGTIYLGTNGALTQTAPTNGAIVVHIGRALTATKLQIDIDTTITTV